ncbi:MAG: chromosomal replication initiator protein DnaA [Deltaproteobacteria bacterium]|jgi:chromosomal replication initiator protein|nr:chromosomal replication initiator protein DnaA [Deltaproteobacteria bacterium]
MEIQRDGAGELSSASGQLWPEAKKILAQRLLPGTLSPQIYSAWIEPLAVRKTGPDSVSIVSPNEFFHRYVIGHFRQAIETALREGAVREGGDSLEVSFTFSQFRAAPIPKEIMSDQFLVRPFSAPGQAQAPRRGPNDLLARHALSLNRCFTFSNFVVGSPNRLALSSTRAFSEDTNLGTGILYLLSENGLGKSHLSQALAHHVMGKTPQRRVLYVTAEHFLNLMTMCINRKIMDEFKRYFREQCDILMVEDVTFLSGKERLQDELRMTLDTLLDRGKKIIFTSTQPPKQIPGIDKSLRSRMNSGLIASIGAPDFDTRLKILDRKASGEGLRLDRKVLELIADRVTSDVRLLEASVASIKVAVMDSGRPADVPMAEECVKALPTGTDRASSLTLEKIRSYVCQAFNMEESVLAGKSRLRRHSDVRCLCIYLSRRLTGKTLVEIGNFYGRRHSSALYTCNKMDAEYRNDPKVTRQVDYYIGELTRQRAS